MRCLKRNKQCFYYALYTGVTAVTDTEGQETGEYAVNYGTPVEIWGNISGAKGNSKTQPFGEDENYTRTISLEGIDYQIDNKTKLWVGITPGTTTNPIEHNYNVVRVSKTLNSTVIAIKEVEVS